MDISKKMNDKSKGLQLVKKINNPMVVSIKKHLTVTVLILIF